MLEIEQEKKEKQTIKEWLKLDKYDLLIIIVHIL